MEEMEEQTPYVSCIRISKQPIIPPLLNEERRAEMRYYRELAIALETQKVKRNSTDSGVMINSTDGSYIKKPETPTEPLISKNYENEDDEPELSPNSSETEENVFIENKFVAVDPSKQIRRSSYTLENPSPVLIEYVQSRRSSDKKCELFINPETENDVIKTSTEQFSEQSMQEGTELTIEALNMAVEAVERELNQSWNPRDEENLEKIHLNTSIPEQAAASVPEIILTSSSPAAINSYDTKSLDWNEFSRLETANQLQVTDLDDCSTCICNTVGSISNSPRLKGIERSFSENNSCYLLNDSFCKDFRQLDVSVSCESDTCQESRYSDCSSVSLNKFLTHDRKQPDGQEAEVAAFTYMKEMLEQKHRDEFLRLLEEQQREHDNLKAQFGKISALSKSTPSPKCSYEYSKGVVLKKYSPVEKSSSVMQKSCEFSREETSTPKPLKKTDKIANKVDSLPKKTRQKIHALVVGHLTRKLFKTERVTLLVQTIKDCLVTAVSLQNETDLGLSELDLQSRLLQQMTGACNELHHIFGLPPEKRVAIIAADREKKNRLSLKRRTPLPLSEATKRTLERRNTTQSASPAVSKKPFRKRCKSVSSATSDTSTCRSTPNNCRRLLANNIMSQKCSISQRNKQPWR